MANNEYGRVLVVDDDALIRATLAAALGDEGYAVQVAGDGRAALDTMSRWRPDVIVLDLMMPVMDGRAFRLAQRSITETAMIPVIILSAAHELHTRTAGLDPDAILAKPFDLAELLDTVADLVRDRMADLPD